MKIVAKIAGENPALVKKLVEKGIAAKLVRGGIVVDLPKPEILVGDPKSLVRFPAEISKATLYIDCVESGGAATNTGSGTIVCGLQGQALRPYHIPSGGHLANGTHGYFSVAGAVVTITGYNRNNSVTIIKYTIVRQDDRAWIESEEVWRGDLAELPDTYAHFKAAAEAARKKGHCYHCRSSHYHS